LSRFEFRMKFEVADLRVLDTWSERAVLNAE